jgi:hypothetical protein
MTWTLLDSGSLRAARYQEPELVLEVEFCDGAIHRYFRVPERTFQELLRADSKGRFFNLHIRKTFPSQRIRRAGVNLILEVSTAGKSNKNRRSSPMRSSVTQIQTSKTLWH